MRITTQSPIGFCIAFCLLAPLTQATTVLVGALSYDTFIPAGGGSAGVDAFNFSNLTGAFSLPPDFTVSDALMFKSASLTLMPSGMAALIFNLGDIEPGFLLDGMGNPVVQVPGDQIFTAAEFMATLSPTTFMLSNGSLFTVGSAAIDVLLLPSSGLTLTVDVDQTPIGVSDSTITAEPASRSLVLLALIFLALGLRSKWLYCARFQG